MRKGEGVVRKETTPGDPDMLALVVVVVDPQEHMPQFTKNVYFTCAALHFNVSLNKRELILD